MLDSAQYYHVVTITGPRQSGKTALCEKLFPDLPYVNLENAESLLTVEQDPVKFIASHPNGVIIDEAHHFPKIFSYIQVASSTITAIYHPKCSIFKILLIRE